MPSYEICYTDRQGALVGKIPAKCTSPRQAAVLGHGLKFRGWPQLEVWDGEILTYRRPALLGAERAGHRPRAGGVALS